jgi:hypothetical protein
MTHRIDFFAPTGPPGDQYGYALCEDDGTCRMFDMNGRYELSGVWRMEGEETYMGYLVRDGVKYSPMPLIPNIFFYDNLFLNQYL